MKTRAGFSLVETLIATVVLAVLGLAIYEVLISSTRGVQTDRLTEAKRHIVLDLLELYSQPYSDITGVFHGQPTKSRKLSLDETFSVLAIPEEERPVLKSILESGKVEGFTLSWTPSQKTGRGNPDLALRLDALWCTPVVTGDSPGPRTESFRIAFARGKVVE